MLSILSKSHQKYIYMIWLRNTENKISIKDHKALCMDNIENKHLKAGVEHVVKVLFINSFLSCDKKKSSQTVEKFV